MVMANGSGMERQELTNVGAGSLRGRQLRNALDTFVVGVRADFEFMRAARAKYLNDRIEAGSLGAETIKRIGLQMMVAIRGMHFLRDAGYVQGAQVASRLIRHIYGAEIHWQSRWDPGVNIVHGNGLVVSGGAHIRKGCLLLHNVTLGEAYDHQTGRIGGPSLGENVHIGPNTALIGPIEVGAGSKIMAGCMLEHSVPAHSLVKPAKVVVTTRKS